MNDLIQGELQRVIKDWLAGKPVHTIAIGHPVRFNERTKSEEPHVFRQKRAHDYCFQLLEECLNQGQPVSWELFSVIAGSLAPGDLSIEEHQAAASLAWKALSRGWRNAIHGYPEHQYIDLVRETEA